MVPSVRISHAQVHQKKETAWAVSFFARFCVIKRIKSTMPYHLLKMYDALLFRKKRIRFFFTKSLFYDKINYVVHMTNLHKRHIYVTASKR